MTLLQFQNLNHQSQNFWNKQSRTVTNENDSLKKSRGKVSKHSVAETEKETKEK